MEKLNRTSAQQIVDDLERLDYFKFVQPINKHKIKNAIIQHLIKYGTAEAESDEGYEDLAIGEERRTFFVDAENLAEGDGSFVLRCFYELFLKGEGVELDFSKIEDDTDGNYYNLIIGDTTYLLFTEEQADAAWSYAYENFVRICNDLLQSVGSEERLYYNDHDDGLMLLLTNQQFNYFQNTDGLAQHWRPKKLIGQVMKR